MTSKLLAATVTLAVLFAGARQLGLQPTQSGRF